MDKLKSLRNKIDSIDEQIAKLYSERLTCSEEIGKIKKEYQLPILNLEREKEVIENSSSFVKEKYRDSYKKIIKLIIEESKKFQ